jgi:adenine phosphoribosyltransferase
MKTTMKKGDLKKSIRDVPDFPKPGILFKDITPLLSDPIAFKKSINMLVKKYKKENITHVVAVESRGFIFGSPVAYKLGAGFIPVRKKGKLPYKTRNVSYQLEYGTDTLEMHEDALNAQSRVLIVDDLLATGGTVEAVAKLVKGFGAAIVGIAFVIELRFLHGNKKLAEYPLYSIIKY